MRSIGRLESPRCNSCGVSLDIEITLDYGWLLQRFERINCNSTYCAIVTAQVRSIRPLLSPV